MSGLERWLSQKVLAKHAREPVFRSQYPCKSQAWLCTGGTDTDASLWLPGNLTSTRVSSTFSTRPCFRKEKVRLEEKDI